MEFFQNIILKQHSFGNNTILNDKNTFHIAFGIDANFTIGTGVLIYSILQQTNHNIIFHILLILYMTMILNALKCFVKNILTLLLISII